MKHSFKVGFSFGTTSGIITTLGLMIGLHSTTKSSLAIMGGILTIAAADAFSDALGIHISEESETIHTPNEIWVATIATFFAKFIFALTFVVPILLFELSTAIITSIIWGLSLLSYFSYKNAKLQKINPWKAVGEHLAIAFVVIVITHYLGDWIGLRFK